MSAQISIAPREDTDRLKLSINIDMPQEKASMALWHGVWLILEATLGKDKAASALQEMRGRLPEANGQPVSVSFKETVSE